MPREILINSVKILHLIHKQQNRGAETFACQLATHQENLGHQIFMVTVYPGSANLPWKGKFFCIEGSEEKNIFDLKAWKNLYNLIKKLVPDIIQANSGDTLKYAIFSKKVFGWKTPLVFRNASEVGRYLNTVFQKKLNGYLYKQVSGIASVSKASKLDIVGYFPFLKGKTRVIPVGLEPHSNLEVLSLQPIGKKHIVHVGGFSFEKNHKELIEIFNRVQSQNDNVHLHLVGDGKLKCETEALVQKKGLEDKVSFYGFVNNPLAYIAAADILVLPSIIEGLPGVLLEAMYLKTPVVANNVGGISEIVTENTGVLIDKDDNQAFTNSVLRVLNKPDDKQIETAYNLVKRDYMNKKLTRLFLEFYEEVIQQE